MSEGTYKQRTFDCLAAVRPNRLTVEQIVKRTKLPLEVVRGALERLKRDKVLLTVYWHDEWTFTLKDSAMRPIDRRGGARIIRRKEMA